MTDMTVAEVRERARADLARVDQQVVPLAAAMHHAWQDHGLAAATAEQLTRQLYQALPKVEGTARGVAEATEALSRAQHLAAIAHADVAHLERQSTAATQHRHQTSRSYAAAAAALAAVDPDHNALCHCHEYEGNPHAPHVGSPPIELEEIS